MDNNINQVIKQFLFKPRLNNTPMNPMHLDQWIWTHQLSIKRPHKHFLTEFDEKRVMEKICYDLKD